MVYYRSLARSRAAGPERNGTETEQKCTGGVQVIERQTAELTFRFDGTERNGTETSPFFMLPTVVLIAITSNGIPAPYPGGQNYKNINHITFDSISGGRWNINLN